MVEIFVWAKDVERAVRKVREHAEKRENWYRLGITQALPGDDAFHVVWSGTTKAVFTWTVVGRSWDPRHPPAGSILRHLTVSVRGENRYPYPDVCYTFAHHFGFTGSTVEESGLCRVPGPTWVMGQDAHDQCVVIQQLLQGVTDAPLPSTVQ